MLISSSSVNIQENIWWINGVLYDLKNKTSIWCYTDGTIVLTLWVPVSVGKAENIVPPLSLTISALHSTAYRHHQLAESSTQGNVLELAAMSSQSDVMISKVFSN